MKNLVGKKMTMKFVKKGTPTQGKPVGKATLSFKKIPQGRVKYKNAA